MRSDGIDESTAPLHSFPFCTSLLFALYPRVVYTDSSCRGRGVLVSWRLPWSRRFLNSK